MGRTFGLGFLQFRNFRPFSQSRLALLLIGPDILITVGRNIEIVAVGIQGAALGEMTIPSLPLIRQLIVLGIEILDNLVVVLHQESKLGDAAGLAGSGVEVDR